MIDANMTITGKGIAAIHMMPHVRPADEPWNSICAAIGKDYDALAERCARLEEAISDACGRLRINDDNAGIVCDLESALAHKEQA